MYEYMDNEDFKEICDKYGVPKEVQEAIVNLVGYKIQYLEEKLMNKIQENETHNRMGTPEWMR